MYFARLCFALSILYRLCSTSLLDRLRTRLEELLGQGLRLSFLVPLAPLSHGLDPQPTKTKTPSSRGLPPTGFIDRKKKRF